VFNWLKPRKPKKEFEKAYELGNLLKLELGETDYLAVVFEMVGDIIDSKNVDAKNHLLLSIANAAEGLAKEFEGISFFGVKAALSTSHADKMARNSFKVGDAFQSRGDDLESQISTLAFYLVGASLLAKSGTGRVNSAQEKLADGLIETALTFTHQMRNLKTYAEQGFPKE
jgi:hypothetical protein